MENKLIGVEKEIDEAYAKLKASYRKWNCMLDEFLAEAVPNPVRIRTGKKEYVGMLKAKLSPAWAHNEVALYPFKKDGTLSDRSVAYPTVWATLINKAETYEELVAIIKERMGIIEETEVQDE